MRFKLNTPPTEEELDSNLGVLRDQDDNSEKKPNVFQPTISNEFIILSMSWTTREHGHFHFQLIIVIFDDKNLQGVKKRIRVVKKRIRVVKKRISPVVLPSLHKSIPTHSQIINLNPKLIFKNPNLNKGFGVFFLLLGFGRRDCFGLGCYLRSYYLRFSIFDVAIFCSVMYQDRSIGDIFWRFPLSIRISIVGVLITLVLAFFPLAHAHIVYEPCVLPDPPFSRCTLPVPMHLTGHSTVRTIIMDQVSLWLMWPLHTPEYCNALSAFFMVLASAASAPTLPFWL